MVDKGAGGPSLSEISGFRKTGVRLAVDEGADVRASPTSDLRTEFQRSREEIHFHHAVDSCRRKVRLSLYFAELIESRIYDFGYNIFIFSRFRH